MKPSCLRGLLLLTLAALAPLAFAQVLGTTDGEVRGTTDGPVSAFRGIPYAAPPVGPNRWRAPQPVVSWNGVRDATRSGSDCAQALFPPDAAPIETAPSEDCLLLNVWKPAAATR